MKIGFAGLGQMGRPIAHNLLRSEDELVVVDRSDRAFPEFQAAGATGSTDPQALASSEIVFLCLPSDKVVRSFLFGDDGLALHLARGQIAVD